MIDAIKKAATDLRLPDDTPYRSLALAQITQLAKQFNVPGSTVEITALENNDRELAEFLIGNMDLAMDELLSARATVGSRMIRMETTRNRLEQTQITVTSLLSEVEDADIVSAVSELAREENLYQAALMASSRIMQQSLIDFLR